MYHRLFYVVGIGVLLAIAACTQVDTVGVPVVQQDLHYQQLSTLEGGEHTNVAFQDVVGDIYTLEATISASGKLVYQGDMVLGTLDEGLNEQAAVVVSRTWPDNTVPYTMDLAMPEEQQDQLEQAMTFYENNTHVQFVPRDEQENYVAFVYSGATAGSVCNSYVGMVDIGEQALNFSSWCGLRGAVHELGHVLGFHHEQARVDRDTYVRFDCTLVDCSEPAWTLRTEAAPYGDYDYASVMHYSAFIQLMVGNQVIERQVIYPLRDGVDPRAIGTGTWPSQGDLAAIAYLYPALNSSAFSSRIESKGSGRCVNVPGATRDGVRLEQFGCNEDESQVFEFLPAEGSSDTYTIISNVSGNCLDIAGGRLDDGAVLMQWICHEDDNQQFELRPDGVTAQLVAVHSGKCLEVRDESNDDGAHLQQAECSASEYQKFYLDGP